MSARQQHAHEHHPQQDPLSLEGHAIENDLKLLIDLLPERLRKELYQHDLDDLIEVVMDLGRPAEARFAEGHPQGTMIDLGTEQVTWEDDAVHGFKGLHDIRPKVDAIGPQYPQVLGKLADKYKGPYVWDLPQWR